MISMDRTIRLGYKDFKVSMECFGSSAELVETVDGRSFRNCYDKDTFARRKLDPEWHCVKSADEAKTLCADGWSAKVSDVLERVRQVRRTMPTSKIATVRSVCGFAPVVPLVLSGCPESMLDVRMTPRRTRTVDVVYDMTCSCKYKAEDLMEVGLEVLEYIMRLEASGYRVRLAMMLSFSDSMSADIVTVKIKDEARPFNLERQCFPLFHPAMFRVIGFGWYERSPTSKYRLGHGKALSYALSQEERQEVAKALFGPNAVMISSADLLNARNDGKDVKGVLESAIGI